MTQELPKESLIFSSCRNNLHLSFQVELPLITTGWQQSRTNRISLYTAAASDLLLFHLFGQNC